MDLTSFIIRLGEPGSAKYYNRTPKDPHENELNSVVVEVEKRCKAREDG